MMLCALRGVPGSPALLVYSCRPPCPVVMAQELGGSGLSYWSFRSLVMWSWASDSSSVT